MKLDSANVRPMSCIGFFQRGSSSSKNCEIFIKQTAMKRVKQMPVELRQTTMREAKFLSGTDRVLLLS